MGFWKVKLLEMLKTKGAILNPLVLENPNLETTNFSFPIPESLFNRLNKHILMLKHLKGCQISKQQWINEAVNEKLENKKPSKQKENTVYITFHISKIVCQKIQEKMKVNTSSQKKWILEAMLEKLARDEDKSQELLNELLSFNESKNNIQI